MKTKFAINFNNEEVLIHELKKYNEKAFDFFVLKYQKMITSYINRMINNSDEAWNISQEVFIAVFKNIKEFRAESSLKTWLFRIARNFTINRIKYLTVRKTNKHNSIENTKEKFPNYDISVGESPLLNLQKKENVELIHLALSKLKENDREVITLRDLEELNYDEIAEILELSLGTVKSRLFRAREKLKVEYQLLESENE